MAKTIDQQNTIGGPTENESFMYGSICVVNADQSDAKKVKLDQGRMHES